ncbi:Flp pilus assembly protein CpaB [Fusibacter bizertensis]|uniref:Flp pilus assembly protein CpaB n=1 Tax=Fusibacter bizertensis TaxID=1488331 RepID=A0ABT6NA72_9FIRM|nr:Flp pilus assembly protein CpaB [Fusibacter bizertensis]MDH8677311.1 Flp pilus assembly protein CpaB [Fusibacter bizertensis]
MKKSNKGIFLVAFLLALLGAGALYVYLRSIEPPAVAEIRTTGIVVASTEIQARTQISLEMLKVIEVPEQGVVGTPYKTPNDIVGKYAKESIYEGQQIHPNAIIDNVSDELTLNINGSNRAVTINVSELTGVNGLIKPGDFVDIILFLPQTSENNRIRPDIAKLFLQNVEVLAINKNTIRENAKLANSENSDVGSYYVTLSVPVMDVEMLVLAKDIGTVELALRPLEGDYIYVTEGAIWQELLLNDMNQMKDMAPEYGIIGTDTDPNIASEYEYDKYIYYVVQFGDTLKSISTKFYGEESYYSLLQQVNRIDDVDMILTGTGIKIPVLKKEGVGDGN